MFKPNDRKNRRNAIHERIRRRLSGTAERPRLAFHKSLNHLYVQLIDDEQGRTLASASTLSKALRGKVPARSNVAAAKAIGEAIAEIAKEKRIEQVVFDRGGHLFHGVAKAVADAARAKGLKF